VEKPTFLNRPAVKKQIRSRSLSEHFTVNHPETSREVAAYFEERRKRHNVVMTTTTPSGQILDWIPIESQFPGGKVPELPAMKAPEVLHGGKQPKLVSFELDDPAVDRGPEGTVPVLRKNFSKTRVAGTIKNYLAKNGPDGRRITGKPRGARSAPPSPFGYWHCTYGQSFQGISTDCAGTVGMLNVWAPFVEDSGVPNFLGIPFDYGHSILQTGLQNYDNPQLQSLEAGSTVDFALNGDYEPHLFVYYTTNGYTQDADNQGGYNQDVDGWVQMSSNIFPGATIIGGSAQSDALVVPVVDLAFMQIQYQLIGGFWLFSVNGAIIGGYPASLFIGNAGPGLTLGDHADWVAFWGEVYTSASNPSLTMTEMGSGCFADEGLNYAALISNLSTIDKRGALTDLAGTPTMEAPEMYDMVVLDDFGLGFASAFYVGGPGYGPIFRSLVLQDNNANGYAMDGYGDIVIVGTSPIITELSFLPSYNICRGIVERSGEWGSGYVLDGFGLIHPYGPATFDIPLSNCAYWPGWDIARGIVMIQSGLDAGQSGYVLDGFGGVHPWWAPGAPQPPAVSINAYWPGWDIARGFVICSDWLGGYVLDGWGGIHSWGNAPAAANVTAYWPGWDIARAICLLPNDSSGYVLDGWGGIHPWGGAPGVTPSYYTPGQDRATSIALTPDGTQGAVLDNAGGVHQFSIP
jgi:hypothetical protein